MAYQNDNGAGPERIDRFIAVAALGYYNARQTIFDRAPGHGDPTRRAFDPSSIVVRFPLV
jgi:hypothetical protein